MEDFKLVSAGDDIKIWGPPGYTLLHQFNPHSVNLSSVSWSKDTQFLASASLSGDKVVLTCLKNAAYTSFDLAVGGKQTCVAFGTSSQHLLTAGKDKQISLWDVKSQKLIKTYKGHRDNVTAICFNWNDTYIASGCEKGEIILHNVTTGQGISPLVVPKEIQAIRALKYNYFKKSILGSVSDDGTVHLWDTNARKLYHSFSNAHKAPATGIAFSPINELLFMTAGLDKRIICYDLSGKRILKVVNADSPLTCLDLLHDGATLAVGTTRGKIHIYDFRSAGMLARTLMAHKTSVQDLIFQKFQTLQNDYIGSKASWNVSMNSNQPLGENHLLRENSSKLLKEYKSDISQQNRIKSSSTSSSEDIFSPIRDGLSEQVTLLDSRGSENRPDLIGSATPAPYDANPDSDIFSPLPDNANNGESIERKNPIGLGDASTLGTRPVPTGLADSDIHIPILTKVDQNSVLPSLTPSSTHQSPVKLANEDAKTIHSSLQSLPNEIANKHSIESSSFKGSSSKYTISPRKHNLSSTNVPLSGNTSPNSKMTSAFASRFQPEPNNDTSPNSQASGLSVKKNFQMELITKTVTDILEDFRDDLHTDILSLHSTMIHQFQIQLEEMKAVMENNSSNHGLLAEIKQLREEVQQLKKKY